jgi:hypothetical protein
VQPKYTDYWQLRKNDGINLPHVLREKKLAYISKLSAPDARLSEIVFCGYSALFP